MAIHLGCIADDFTGATDLANTLVKQGMRAVQVIGVPDATIDVCDAEAVVVALKSRTIPADEAVGMSLKALAWLRRNDAQQIFFKYCSTFDSTHEGNIGPVGDALLEALGADIAVVCPAFPATGRSVFNGYLFVGDQLLSDTSMKDHPLTPMRDASLIRLLEAQSTHRAGLVAHDAVERGAGAIAERMRALHEDGHRYAVVDAIADDNLVAIGEACDGLALVTGGSGVAMGLPANFRRHGALGAARAARLPSAKGGRAVLAGSCSVATRGQLAHVSSRWPSFRLDPLKMAEGLDVADEALSWAKTAGEELPVVIFSSVSPSAISEIQDRLGRAKAGAMVERTFGRIAEGLVREGVRQLIVAGGETSGAVVEALGIQALEIGPEIDPGVPWTTTLGSPNLALALKSGNFGAEDFFSKAFAMLDG
ncbi:MAG: 3-oxo-tetronate kinase [Hyphomicrobiaceae bacterium]